ncbi:MAG: glycoside hydrolase family protein [Nitrosomonas sp.]|nr:glycoside hydrolase family protein [Nitrosomonas sp.]
MDDLNKQKLVNQITRHEKYKQFPYRCSRGKLTAGIGRNLEANGITLDEAQYMLGNDIRHAVHDCEKMFPNFYELDVVRQCVLINMMFNMGEGKFGLFKRFRAAILKKDFKSAAREMQDSAWFQQVGSRSVELTKQLDSGIWQIN